MNNGGRDYLSPLRYPGGKSIIAEDLSRILLYNSLDGGVYLEPYAGGASVALHMLFNGLSERIIINDADSAVFSFWNAITRKPDAFLKKLSRIRPTVAEWHLQREIYRKKNTRNFIQLGFAFFFLNRTSRSGVVQNGGPIGGYDQSGAYKIDVRFNKPALIDRIEKIAKNAKRISVKNLDALRLLNNFDIRQRKFFVYLDPPYYTAGQNLYLNSYNHEDHVRLAGFLQSNFKRNWVLTYDYHAEIKRMYKRQKHRTFNLNYSVNNDRKRVGEELLFFADTLVVPKWLKVGIHET